MRMESKLENTLLYLFECFFRGENYLDYRYVIIYTTRLWKNIYALRPALPTAIAMGVGL